MTFTDIILSAGARTPFGDFGKSLRERAQELIAIAHPDFREELRAAARKRRFF